MIEMQIKVEGLDKVREAFAKAPGVLDRHLRRAMDASIKTVQRPAQEYPPPPAGSTYVRTGTLGRRWSSRVESIAGGVRGTLENPTPYGPFVQGDQQAVVHRGRWRTLRQIAERAKKDVVEHHERELAAAIKEITRG